MHLTVDVNGRVIDRCAEKLADFIAYDAYPTYDRRGIPAEPRPDVISREQLRLMNSAMRARSRVASWLEFLDRPLPKLAAVPTDVDLIDSSDGEVGDALAHLWKAVDSLCVPWITDMAATKLLYLKRPRLVAISDSYVRQQLGVRARVGPDRAVAVARAVRAVGLENAGTLEGLKTHSDTLTDAAAPLSKARILDILIWIEEARRSKNLWWSQRYPQ